MALDPLHTEPLRPRLDGGRLANPIGRTDGVRLDPTVPLRYDDLVPRTTYIDDRFEYLTDGDAMPARIRGALRLVDAATRVRHRGPQVAVGHLGGAAGPKFHGGHFVAVSLGGFASGPNLFPQYANFNQSAYKRLEEGWREALRNGCTLEVDIAVAEGDELHVPSLVLVTYWEDGEEWELNFVNEPHAQ